MPEGKVGEAFQSEDRRSFLLSRACFAASLPRFCCQKKLGSFQVTCLFSLTDLAYYTLHMLRYTANDVTNALRTLFTMPCAVRPCKNCACCMQNP